MNKNLLSATAIVLAALAYPSSSQVVMPEMTLHRYDSLAVNNAADGRIVRRMEGATVGLIRVEWPAGTRTTPHNHANELVVFLVEGRLKAISGDDEFIARAWRHRRRTGLRRARLRGARGLSHSRSGRSRLVVSARFVYRIPVVLDYGIGRMGSSRIGLGDRAAQCARSGGGSLWWQPPRSRPCPSRVTACGRDCAIGCSR